jgi:hypothetical protein
MRGSYWCRVISRSLKFSFGLVFHSLVRVLIEFAILGLAFTGLWAMRLKEVVHGHFAFEISLVVSAVLIFIGIFIGSVACMPAILDREMRDRSKKRMAKSRASRARFSQKIIELSRPPNNPKLENFRNTLNGLDPWMVELLKALAFKGPMNEPMALAHFGTSGIAPVHLHLLSILDGKTAWLNRDPYGKFTISEKVEKELIEIFQSQAR